MANAVVKVRPIALSIGGTPHEPTGIKNMDIVGVVERMDRAVYDMGNNNSAETTILLMDDAFRIRDQALVIIGYAAAINEQNHMDTPHSKTPYTIRWTTVEPLYNFDAIKNELIRDITRYYISGWEQLTRSDSADVSNKWTPNDYGRFEQAMLRVLTTIEGYIAAVEDGTLPEDIPQMSNYERSTA